MRILVKNMIFVGRFEPEGGGRHIGSHEGLFRSYALHNGKRKKERGGCSCFEEAQDSYGLEANPQRDNSSALRERERHKVQKTYESGKKRREETAGKKGGISRIAAKNHKLLCCGKKHRSS